METHETSQMSQPESAMPTMPRGKMSKAQLAAFMKAKLAKTKVSSAATTGASASGQNSKNFTAPKGNKEPTRGKDFLTNINRKVKPGQKKAVKEESDSEEDDFATANAKMMEAAKKF